MGHAAGAGPPRTYKRGKQIPNRNAGPFSAGRARVPTAHEGRGARLTMSFDDDGDAPSRLYKYMYWGEKIVARGLAVAAALGVFVLFWEGWVEGAAQYHKAQQTVDICRAQRDSILGSDLLRGACEAASLSHGMYPVFFAVRFALLTLLNGLVTTLCHVGGSWASSAAMGVAFTALMAYVYRRATGPPNPYALAMAAARQPRYANADLAALYSTPPCRALEYAAPNNVWMTSLRPEPLLAAAPRRITEVATAAAAKKYE